MELALLLKRIQTGPARPPPLTSYPGGPAPVMYRSPRHRVAEAAPRDFIVRWHRSAAQIVTFLRFCTTPLGTVSPRQPLVVLSYAGKGAQRR